MKKFILIAILFGLCSSICFAQKHPAAKIIQPKQNQPATITEISEADWKILTDALQREEWTKADALAVQYMKNITAENDKKQLAQLRYIYLYALAGEILIYSDTKLGVEEAAEWTILDKAVSGFINKEFVLPPHEFLSDCKNSVNYICPVKGDDHALRITETNKSGTAIHSFDYVLFDERIAPAEAPANKIFLGGNLKRAEFNQDLSQRWVMRLIFERGFLTLADDK